jgi:hypothetical protein
MTMDMTVKRLNGIHPRPALSDVLRCLADLAEALAAGGDVQPLSLNLSHAGVRLSLRAWRGAGPSPEPEDVAADYTADTAAQPDCLRETYLTPVERMAVKAVRQNPLPGELLARRMGKSFGGARTIMAALVARGVLRTGARGTR